MKKIIFPLGEKIEKSALDIVLNAECGEVFCSFNQERRGEKETFTLLESIGVDKSTLSELKSVAIVNWELGAEKISFYPYPMSSKKKITKKSKREVKRKMRNQFLSDFASRARSGVLNKNDILLFFKILKKKNISLVFTKKNKERRTFLVEKNKAYGKINIENILFKKARFGNEERPYFYGKEIDGDSEHTKWIYFDTILSANLEDK